MAAQAGTTTGLGSTVGEGDGEGEGVSAGVGLGLLEGVACFVAAGLELGASGPFAVQPASDSRDKRTTTPFLTRSGNDLGYGLVTGLAWRRKTAQDTRGPER